MTNAKDAATLDFHAMPGHLIRRLNQISVALFADHMSRAGLSLTPVQFAALSTLDAHPGIDQATLAGLAAYDRATLGKVINRLETRGLILRDVSAKDRRAKSLELTDAGRSLLSQARPIVAAFQPDILAGLAPDERANFLTMLKKTAMAGNARSRAPLRPLDR